MLLIWPNFAPPWFGRIPETLTRWLPEVRTSAALNLADHAARSSRKRRLLWLLLLSLSAVLSGLVTFGNARTT